MFNGAAPLVVATVGLLVSCAAWRNDRVRRSGPLAGTLRSTVAGVVVAGYVAIAVTAYPALANVLGARGALMGALLPFALGGWLCWSWRERLAVVWGRSTPRPVARRELIERVLSVTRQVSDVDAVAAMVRAGILELCPGAQVHFWASARTGAMLSSSRVLPTQVHSALARVSEPIVFGTRLAHRVGVWPESRHALLVPVRRGQQLFGCFAIHSGGYVDGEDLLSAAALADHLATKIENALLQSSLGQTGRELAQVKRFLEDLIESLPVGVVGLVGPELRVRTWNPAEARRTGIPKEQALGRQYLTEIASGHVGPAVLDALRRRPAEVLSFPNVPWSAHANGSSVDVTIAPLRPRGDPSEEGYVLIMVDNSERNALQHDVEEYRRLAALGQFAGAIAHDIRTPLSSMRMSVQILRSKVSLPPEDMEYFDLTLESIDRLNHQVHELLDFTKPALLRIDDVEVTGLFEQAAQLVADKAREAGVALHTHAPVGLWLPIDEARVIKMLVHLLNNAIEATPSGGLVQMGAEQADDQDAIVLFVQDAGAGIVRQDLERIWEPFFTTRPDGAGLGLAIVRKIVQAHGGEATVHSEAGSGTRMEVRLPARRSMDLVTSYDAAATPAEPSVTAVRSRLQLVAAPGCRLRSSRTALSAATSAGGKSEA